jgi:hypothetical protein
MSTTINKTDEARLAAEIVGVLDPSVVRACSDVRDAIRYAVRGKSLKLRSIVLGRNALRRLLKDPAGAVKIEYLKRDLLRAVMQRIEYRYPRAITSPSCLQETDLAQAAI